MSLWGSEGWNWQELNLRSSYRRTALPSELQFQTLFPMLTVMRKSFNAKANRIHSRYKSNQYFLFGKGRTKKYEENRLLEYPGVEPGRYAIAPILETVVHIVNRITW